MSRLAMVAADAKLLIGARVTVERGPTSSVRTQVITLEPVADRPCAAVYRRRNLADGQAVRDQCFQRRPLKPASARMPLRERRRQAVLTRPVGDRRGVRPELAADGLEGRALRQSSLKPSPVHERMFAYPPD